MLQNALIAASLIAAAAQPQPASTAAAQEERLPEDEVIYLIMPDRFENGDPTNDREMLVVFNMTKNVESARVPIEAYSREWRTLHGSCPTRTAPDGRIELVVEPLDYVVCKSVQEAR